MLPLIPSMGWWVELDDLDSMNHRGPFDVTWNTIHTSLLRLRRIHQENTPAIITHNNEELCIITRFMEPRIKYTGPHNCPQWLYSLFQCRIWQIMQIMQITDNDEPLYLAMASDTIWRKNSEGMVKVGVKRGNCKKNIKGARDTGNDTATGKIKQSVNLDWNHWVQAHEWFSPLPCLRYQPCSLRTMYPSKSSSLCYMLWVFVEHWVNN